MGRHLYDWNGSIAPVSSTIDFRYDERMALGVSDEERAIKALKGIEGRPLTYRRTGLGKNV
jgi:hypothetical protein